ncbi:MAG: SDR family oxidoreductase [Candidatus Tectomicrobia bacterium]|uniref:SDR family oxidoreductase n=1 Tax=Tectimicrobiota bacterium TaxID=2528274 RepID=A0A938B2J8_UNCTE|nr:SDR family oxidoreductase [Candidatus Tectomicrobia bacterium]
MHAQRCCGTIALHLPHGSIMPRRFAASARERNTTMELEGQVAIVTGAGRGIGRATALELARMGAHIVVAELDPTSAQRTVEEVRATGRRALVVPTDVTSRDALRTMVERTRAEFARLDILINNAGIYRAAASLDITEEHWDTVLNINAKAVFFASQAVLPTMIAQRRGAIVSLASMAGKVGSRTNLPYNASKAAVISITKSLALAHAADGIRVNCVCPGYVETAMWQAVARDQGALLGLSPEDFTEQRAAQVPLGRMEHPEDVAKVIGFLASDRAGYMTGQAINVTGGLIMH